MHARKYGLYERCEDGRHWKRLYPALEGSLPWARRVFQDALLARFMGAECRERRLRPVSAGEMNTTA